MALASCRRPCSKTRWRARAPGRVRTRRRLACKCRRPNAESSRTTIAGNGHKDQKRPDATGLAGWSQKAAARHEPKPEGLAAAEVSPSRMTSPSYPLTRASAPSLFPATFSAERSLTRRLTAPPPDQGRSRSWRSSAVLRTVAARRRTRAALDELSAATTGGTGPGSKDCAPEAARPACLHFVCTLRPASHRERLQWPRRQL